MILNPVGSGATGVANMSGGAVTSIRITDNGSGFNSTTPPTVTLTPFGSGALATSTLSGGSVNGVTVTNPGVNYAVPPVVTFSPAPGGGTTATGVATVGGVAHSRPSGSIGRPSSSRSMRLWRSSRSPASRSPAPVT